MLAMCKYIHGCRHTCWHRPTYTCLVQNACIPRPMLLLIMSSVRSIRVSVLYTVCYAFSLNFSRGKLQRLTSTAHLDTEL